MTEMSFDRRIDEGGKVELPVEFRQELDLEAGNSVTITLHDRSMLIKKTVPFCRLCGGSDGLTVVAGKIVCNHCIAEIKAGKRLERQ